MEKNIRIPAVLSKKYRHAIIALQATAEYPKQKKTNYNHNL